MTHNTIDQTVFQTLVETVGDDFIGEMIDAFLEEGAMFIADMDSALKNQDIDHFRRAAHSLKSYLASWSTPSTCWRRTGASAR